MRFLASEKIGEHKYKTPEGYLICVDAILSRTGKQEYKRSELFGDTCDNADDVTYVNRTDDEVFSEASLASFENKAICLEHPDEDVNVENHNDLSIGFVRDIHKGIDNGQPVMMGTLVFTNKDAIELIESGEYKELSCGYDCDIEDNDELIQKNIRGNHIALCKQGRAGIARIVDAVDDMAVMRFEFSTNIAAFERAIINNDIAEFNSMLNVFEKDLSDYKKWKNEGRLSAADIGKVKRQIDKINSLLKKSKINKIFEVKDMAVLKNIKKHDIKDEKFEIDGELDEEIKHLAKRMSVDVSKGKANKIIFTGTKYAINRLLQELGADERDGQYINDDYNWTEVEEENYEKANEAIMTKDTASMRDKVDENKVFNLVKNAGYVPEKIYRGGAGIEFEIRKGKFGNIEVAKLLKKNGYDAETTTLYGVVVYDTVKRNVADNKEQIFTVEYEKDGVMHINKVRAKSIDDAIKKVKDATLPPGVKFIDDGYWGIYEYRGFKLYWRRDLQSFGIHKDGSLVDIVEGLDKTELPYELKKEVDMYYEKRPFWAVKHLD